MGLLSLGTPLSWEEASKYADHVRREGIEQFINAYRRGQRHNPDFWSWGDEIEYVLVEIDDESQTVRLNLQAEQIVRQLNERADSINSIWHPEYAKYMLESTPALPYSRTLKSFLSVEENMRARRVEAAKHLRPQDRVLSMANFPLLGTTAAFPPPATGTWTNEASRSCFIPDEAINSHARFKTLTRNIRTRRGQKVEISLPLYMDSHTDPAASSTQPCLFPHDATSPLFLEPGQVYMDCMAFGMGCCCLQLTMQSADMHEARHLYDQFTVLSPVMLALTAASPVFRGLLVDTDCRWSVIEASVDDRNREERGLDPLISARHRIYKSRYASVSRFIANHAANRPEYNDLVTPTNPQAEAALLDAGIDPVLAAHIAHLFVRDPLVVFRELLQQDNTASADHFENIQSTNWQTCRFKPPSLTDAALGWRVEFRPMEVQPTDFENAALVIYVVLLARAILHFHLALYIPLSLVDMNMVRAQKRAASLVERFYFRTNLTDSADPCQISLLSANEIINGRAGDDIPTTLDAVFVREGLSGIIRRYLAEMNTEPHVLTGLERYISFVADRAAGRNPTPATLIRDFVLAHPAYAHDSVVSDRINYDLITRFASLN